MKLYYAKNAISVASQIVLAELDLPIEQVLVDFSVKEQSSEAHLQRNPLGRVPVLETPNGILTETIAILTYMARLNPEAGLLPTDPWQEAKVLAACSYLSTTPHVAHAHKLRGHRWSDDQAVIEAMKIKVRQNMFDAFTILTKGLFTGPYVAGDAMTIADAHLFAIAAWLPADGVPLSELPQIEAHHKLMLSRPSVQKVLALNA